MEVRDKQREALKSVLIRNGGEGAKESTDERLR